MYGSQFDGAAAFSGGGFMPSETTQTPDTSFSPAKNRDVQALLPLTVKQINDASMSVNEKSEFLIDGVDVNNVKLVGILRDRVGRVSDVAFVLDDGTGRIDCNKWLDQAVDANEMDGILEGMYVCAHGRLTNFQGKRTVNVFAIRPVEDYNEIASHFIECIYVHFYNNRSRKLQGGVNAQPQVTRPTNQSFAQYSAAGSKSTEEMVLDFLNQPMYLSREEGASIELITSQLKIPRAKIESLSISLSLKRTYTAQRLESCPAKLIFFLTRVDRMALENLVTEGTAYSTIDDYHFKSAING